MKSVVEYCGYKVTMDTDKKEMTFERLVGSVRTITTLGWVDTDILEVICALKRRDDKMLDYAKKIGLSY